MARRHGAAIGILIALSVAATWPLAANLGRAVSDPGDPYIVTWILDWDWWATFHQPLSLFQANAFYPAKYSLAFSENLYGIAILLFPLRAAGVDPLTAYNIAFIAGFALCGIGAYLLAYALTESFPGALAAGVFYMLVPFRFTHLSHLQHVWGGWLPLLLLALLAYARRPGWGRAIAFGAVFLINGLTNIHYLLFGAFAAGVTAVLLIPRRDAVKIALATLAALMLLAPFLYPYAVVAKLYGMQRSWAELVDTSAHAIDWLPHSGPAELRLYPGWLPLAAALASLLLARREKPKLTLAALWIAIGFLGSLGIHFELHRFLFGAVPGFRAVRVPARWAVIAYVGIAIAIALTGAAIARRHRWAGFLLPVALAASLWQAPIRWYLARPSPPVYRWLAAQPVRAVAELPIDDSTDYEYVLRLTEHRKPIVNGISGFATPFRTEVSGLWRQTPIPDLLTDRLAEAGVDTVIVHADALGDREDVTRDWLRRQLARGRLRFVRVFDTGLRSDWVFAIENVGVARAAPPELQSYLDGKRRCESGLMGVFTFPPPGSDFQGKGSIFSGWVLSRTGIRGVDLLFDNRAVRIPSTVERKPKSDWCGEDPAVEGAVFVAVFPSRPERLRVEGDVEAEVIDASGRRQVFGYRWFSWD